MPTFEKIRRTCLVKVRYPTMEKAMAAIEAMREKHRVWLRAYICPFCGAYHIGNGRWRGMRINFPDGWESAVYIPKYPALGTRE